MWRKGRSITGGYSLEGGEGSGEVGKEQRCQSTIRGAGEASGGAEVQATLGNV